MKKLIFTAAILACSYALEAQVNPRSDSSLYKPGFGTDSAISGGKVYNGSKGQKKTKPGNNRKDTLRPKQHQPAPEKPGIRQERGNLKTKSTATGGK
jgi:hypothetical protein